LFTLIIYVSSQTNPINKEQLQERGEDWNGTIDDEAEEARGKGGDAPEKTARSFRQETSWIRGLAHGP
jgi:hypothetical protein